MRLGISLACVLLIACVAPRFASAGAAIDWDPAFTWEPGATATNSPAGGVLQGVGIVSKFDQPFADLHADDPTREYTFYFYGLVSQGTVPTPGPPPPGSFFYRTEYTGGTFELYGDLSPEPADFVPNPADPGNTAVPENFVDGTLLLQGTFTSFHTTTNNFTSFQTGSMEGEILWTGGTLLDRTMRGGQPCPGLFTGGITWREGLVPAGYIFRHDGKIDLNCPTPTVPSSWGRIKAHYN